MDLSATAKCLVCPATVSHLEAPLHAEDHAQRGEFPIPDGTPARALGTMPGVPRGTPVTIRHTRPSGFSNGLYWLDLGEPIIWSHGVSESTGYWGGRAEFVVDDAAIAPG